MGQHQGDEKESRQHQISEIPLPSVESLYGEDQGKREDDLSRQLGVASHVYIKGWHWRDESSYESGDEPCDAAGSESIREEVD
jgi:hypothetical protein